MKSSFCSFYLGLTPSLADNGRGLVAALHARDSKEPFLYAQTPSLRMVSSAEHARASWDTLYTLYTAYSLMYVMANNANRSEFLSHAGLCVVAQGGHGFWLR